jgi:hypothetical protein
MAGRGVRLSPTSQSNKAPARDAKASLTRLRCWPRRAVSRKPTTPSGHRIKVVLTLFLPHDVAEYLAARAIREGKNVAALVAEILGKESRRPSEER